MRGIIAANPRCATRIKPYIGGDEVNSRPYQDAYRFVIDLNSVATESGLAEWPELADVVRARVKPYRDSLGSNPNNIPLKRRWWAYQAHRPELYRAADQLRRVLVCSQTTKYIAFSFLPKNVVFSQKLNVFLLDHWSNFSLLQSRAHEAWALCFGSTLGETPVYTPSDCFETFPFPEDHAMDAALEAAGEAYCNCRAVLMVRNDEGLTKIYNRFHDPNEGDDGIAQLRELHAAIDRAVLDAYGWRDLAPTCEFLLDYEIDEEESGDRKKPYRYRWPDEVQGEVLSRLLELNAERAGAEARAGAAGGGINSGRRRAAKPAPRRETRDLFS
jgi:hypothetical protein